MTTRFRPFYLLPGTRVGTYVIRDALGQGGGQMAYLADSLDGREVVLKVSRFPKSKNRSSNWKMHERFMRQIAFFIELRGVPGVAHILGYDMHPEPSGTGYVYMVQEWVPDNLNILDWAVKEPHPLKAIVGGWKILANACGEMHRRGICNRDLKPENILVTPQGVPKIVDFDSGIAVGVESITSTGPAKWPGTKCYYSPELCNAIIWKRTPSEYHPQEDLHALGVIFYQVLTGEYPFGEWEDENDLFEHIALQVPQHPCVLNPEVPFGLDKVTMKLLEKAPRLRYQSGDELAVDLEALLTTAVNWRRPFQTPARERDSSASRSRTTRPISEATSTSPGARSRTAVGSAALNLAPSAIVLAGPSALAIRGPHALPRLEAAPSTLAVPSVRKAATEPAPRRLLLGPGAALLTLTIPSVREVAPEPEPRRAVPRRRALLLAAALTLALVVSSLSLGQHEAAGPLFERGTMLLSNARTAVVAFFSMALTACAGLTGEVRAGDLDWLAKCPPESRKAANELAFLDGAVAWMMEGPSVIIPDQGGVEVRDGPVEVRVAISSYETGYQGRLFGKIRTGSDGASLQFTKLKLFDGSEPDGQPPAGPEVDVCALGSVRGYRNFPGIPKVEHPRRPSELHPGYVFVTTGGLEIQFAH